MEFILWGVFGLFIIYKIAIAIGRMKAKDILVTNYGLNRQKISQLSDLEITQLTIALNALTALGPAEDLNKLITQFK